MKTRVLSLIGLLLLTSFAVEAQRGVRIGYIDMEYILQNVPEYQEASIQLDGRVQRWKQDIDKEQQEINQMRLDLSNEKVLLTKEMIEEREEEIQIREAALFQYQQNRFGPNGDLAIQRRQLVQPVQDQVFNIVQEIATSRNYDFIFDKSADVVMLFAAERNDISDQVIRVINRAARRNQATSKEEEREIERRDGLSDEQDQRLSEREQLLEQRRKEREAIMEQRQRERDSIRNARQAEADARRGGGRDTTTQAGGDEDDDDKSTTTTTAQDREEMQAQRQRERDSIRDARQAEAEARRQQMLEDRQRRQDSIREARQNRGGN